MVTLPYQPPVSDLLTYGSCEGSTIKSWPNYVEALALTADHIPALIELVQDATLWQFWDEDIPEADLPELDPAIEPFSAPIHAWRALGQLKAIAAIPVLIQVLVQQDVDWCWEELPEVFGLIGPAAIALSKPRSQTPTSQMSRSSPSVTALPKLLGCTLTAATIASERSRPAWLCRSSTPRREWQHLL
ncbi:MAG: hypothetical protein HC812_12155 [Leptolyngbya sp. RL_3_1]|nr:hypothetical protein [Leptolyngbya sp. RL_3_1]